MKKCNGVFEGGGVRGIGHVGAAWEIERAGFHFADLAGSSAGAIVAALLAARYSSRELKQEMESLDYLKLKGKDWIDYLGTAGKVLSILLHLGIYNTDYLELWMEEMLRRKGIRTFHDIENMGRRLKITASDLTARRLLILPDDLKELGITPGSFPISKAVRMSVSIPVFFEPVRLMDRAGREHLIVDGGLLSNFPVWVLDDGSTAQHRPTLGFRFSDGNETRCTCSQGCAAEGNLAAYLKAIVATCMDAVDNSRAMDGDRERTIRIPTTIQIGGEEKKIGAVDFDIRPEECEALFENGKRAAARFLKTWDFADWKRQYRSEDAGVEKGK